MRLHALEVSGRRLAEQGCYPEAIDVMLMVIAEEPLRESAQTALIEAHLCEGNAIEVRRQFERFAALLWEELRMRPSPGLYGRLGVVPAARDDGPLPRVGQRRPSLQPTGRS